MKHPTLYVTHDGAARSKVGVRAGDGARVGASRGPVGSLVRWAPGHRVRVYFDGEDGSRWATVRQWGRRAGYLLIRLDSGELRRVWERQVLETKR